MAAGVISYSMPFSMRKFKFSLARAVAEWVSGVYEKRRGVAELRVLSRESQEDAHSAVRVGNHAALSLDHAQLAASAVVEGQHQGSPPAGTLILPVM